MCDRTTDQRPEAEGAEGSRGTAVSRNLHPVHGHLFHLLPLFRPFHSTASR
jgi:hypothetical protein